MFRMNLLESIHATETSYACPKSEAPQARSAATLLKFANETRALSHLLIFTEHMLREAYSLFLFQDFFLYRIQTIQSWAML